MMRIPILRSAAREAAPSTRRSAARALLPALALASVLAVGGAAVPAAASVLPAVDAAGKAGTTLGKHYVEVSPGVWVVVKGERERRQVRFARLVAFWSPDQKMVAENKGFPHHRWRNLEGDRLTETWFYPETNKQFVFDSGGRLLTKGWR
jgi:hypothetical protein